MILPNFVVFEGIDGTGTTTQLAKLQSRFQAMHQSSEFLSQRTYFTCEPTTHEIGLLIRKCLKSEIEVTPDTLARLFAADRGEHLYGKNGILTELNNKKAVFSDRYFFSSLAYQGEAGSPTLPLYLNQGFPLPEFVFHFDIDPDTAMNRVEKRGGNLEIYEKRAFQQKVRKKYAEVFEYFSKVEPTMKIVPIDAAQSIDEIHEFIWSIVSNLPKI